MKKILLVEDDATIVEIYELMLKKAGFEVEVLSLGQDVIKKVKSIEAEEAPKPDVILLDLILPDMNGADVLEEIRKHSATKGIKVCILTNQEKSEMMFKEGVKPDKFIIKANITPTQLVELIKKEVG